MGRLYFPKRGQEPASLSSRANQRKRRRWIQPLHGGFSREIGFRLEYRVLVRRGPDVRPQSLASPNRRYSSLTPSLSQSSAASAAERSEAAGAAGSAFALVHSLAATAVTASADVITGMTSKSTRSSHRAV